jgi:hypothetical protein
MKCPNCGIPVDLVGQVAFSKRWGGIHYREEMGPDRGLRIYGFPEPDVVMDRRKLWLWETVPAAMQHLSITR